MSRDLKSSTHPDDRAMTMTLSGQMNRPETSAIEQLLTTSLIKQTALKTLFPLNRSLSLSLHTRFSLLVSMKNGIIYQPHHVATQTGFFPCN
jgi:hypothetical protein